MRASDLKRYPVLADLAEEEREDLVGQLEPRLLAAGETLFQEGDSAEALVLVEAGTLRVTSRRSGEHATLSPGACLGALALFAIGPRQVTAVALEASSVLLLTREDYRRLVADCPGAACRLAEAVLGEVAGLVRSVMNRIAAGVVDRKSRRD